MQPQLLRLAAAGLLLFAPARSGHAQEVRDDKYARMERSCENGNVEDCFAAAKAYDQGKGKLTRSGPRADGFYRRACAGGIWDACEEYGKKLSVGSDLFPRDTVAGDSLLTRACALGPGKRSAEPLGVVGGRKARCGELVKLYRRRIGPRVQDSVNALEQMTGACSAKINDACKLVAVWSQDTSFPKQLPPSPPPPPPPPKVGTPAVATSPGPSPPPPGRNPEKPPPVATGLRTTAAQRTVARSQCEAGNSTACVQAGKWYQSGAGGARDLKLARQLFQLGCDKQNPDACYRVGVMYRDGLGGPKELEQAKAAFQRACDRGGERAACEAARPD